jgi:hypothetical protein
MHCCSGFGGMAGVRQLGSNVCSKAGSSLRTCLMETKTGFCAAAAVLLGPMVV